MKKAKNILSIIGIVFGVLSLVAFILLPMINTWFPQEGFLADLNTVIPSAQMALPNALFDFTKNPLDFSFNGILAFGFGDWVRIGIFLGLILFFVLFLIWFIKILVKNQPIQLILWFLALVGIVACADVVMVNLLYGYQIIPAETTEEANAFSLVFKDFDFARGAELYPLVSIILLTLTQPGVLTEISPVVSIVGAVIAVLAVLGVVILLVSIFVNYAWLNTIKVEKVKKEKKTAVPMNTVDPVKVLHEELKEQPVIANESEVQPQVEREELMDNPFKVVRRILVHKTGKVIRVLNEHYYDVTTNIYVEPGFEEPLEPLETEQEHYEKILNAKGGIDKVESEKKEFKPVEIVKEEKPEPVSETKEEKVAPAKKDEDAGEQQYERISFMDRIKTVDQELKDLYNELKSEIMSYGVKSRVAAGGDTFRLHTKTYVKMTIAGKSMKLYLALNPKDYKGTTYPFQDVSHKNMYKEIPFVFKVKSPLSVQRAKTLIADTMAKDRLVKGEVEKRDWISDIK